MINYSKISSLTNYIKKKPDSVKPADGVASAVVIFLIILVVSLIAGQVILSGNLVSQGQVFSQKEKIRNEIVLKNQQLKEEIRNANNLASLEEKARKLGFVDSQNNLLYLPKLSSLAKADIYQP